jgi:hypothetical protein
LSIQLVGDSRTNHLEEIGNDTIQERSNSDFDIKYATIQFYGNNHISQSDRWIEMKFYVKSPDMLSYNRSSGRHLNMGSTGDVQILLFTSFCLMDFLFG